MWRNDAELFDLMRQKLFTAVLGDVMDAMGLVHQFLPPAIRPLRDDMVALGRAMTVLCKDVAAPHEKPFGLMFEALDDLKPNEIYLTAGGSGEYALWGELMSTRAKLLGSTGAVLHGYSRDTPGILQLDFPTFSIGRYAQDQGPRGHVIDFRVPVEFGSVRVDPGQVVFGDIDGVVTIPKPAEEEVIRRALEKVEKENLVRLAIERGGSAADAFATYGVM